MGAAGGQRVRQQGSEVDAVLNSPARQIRGLLRANGMLHGRTEARCKHPAEDAIEGGQERDGAIG
jgi:hypothetical protein